MIKFEKMLVPVDFTASSMSALEHAVYLGNKLDTHTIDVLHVWKPPRFVDPDLKVQTSEGREQTLTEFVKSKAGQGMKDFLIEIENAGNFEVHGRLESGEPHLRILELANEETYDIIIMGCHGETQTAPLGGIAMKVVRNAPCPVLLIRTRNNAQDSSP
jgi:nucleotide-binding universal stress UspA family protein